MSFFFIFLAVGGASKVAGLTIVQSTVMSILVFAAPAQFAILALMARQRPWLDLLATTALINSRFFVMAAALLPYFRETPRARVLAAMPMLSASTFALPFIRFREGGERVQTGGRVFRFLEYASYAIIGSLISGSVVSRATLRAPSASAIADTGVGLVVVAVTFGFAVRVRQPIVCLALGLGLFLVLKLLAGFV